MEHLSPGAAARPQSEETEYEHPEAGHTPRTLQSQRKYIPAQEPSQVQSRIASMSEIEETIQEVIETASTTPGREDRLNSWIAIFVALSATFMAICNIKDGNICQAMAQAQAHSVSKWSQYQSKSTKQNLAETTLALAQLQKAPDSLQAHYKDEIARYEKEKGEIQAEAKGLEAEYEQLNIHDDQFDMSEACLSVGLALFGITALTKKRWLLIFACCLAMIGVLLGLGGFLGWSFHPGWLAKLLG